MGSQWSPSNQRNSFQSGVHSWHSVYIVPVRFPAKRDLVSFLSHILILSKGFYRNTLLYSICPSEACHFCWVRHQWLDGYVWFLKWVYLGTGLLVGLVILLLPLPPFTSPFYQPLLLAIKLIFPPRLLARTARAWRITELLCMPAAYAFSLHLV